MTDKKILSHLQVHSVEMAESAPAEIIGLVITRMVADLEQAAKEQSTSLNLKTLELSVGHTTLLQEFKDNYLQFNARVETKD